jgi:hypothetical protein
VADANDLYGLPLEQFVPERAALAKQLRGEGERAEAARVAKLPKPSVAAWAVNQLVRTQSTAIKELFGAGDELIAAQSALVSGSGDANALRDAVQRERTAVGTLVETARGLLGASGNELSQTMLDRISDTLHAAALDEDARAEVRDGCLVRELRHVGLGAGGFAGAPASQAPARGGRAATPKPYGRRPASRSEKEVREEARRAERERAEQRHAAKRAEADARRAAALAQRKLEVAVERRDRAAAALEQAEAEVYAARTRVEETTAELDRAAEDLRRVRDD